MQRRKTLWHSLLVSLVALGIVSAAVVAWAAAADRVLEGVNQTADTAALSRGDGQDPTTALAGIFGGTVNVAFGTVAVIFVVVIMIGGLKWMQAMGNEEQISGAKKMILNGIFGLMVIFLAYALVFILSLSLGSAVGDPEAVSKEQQTIIAE